MLEFCHPGLVPKTLPASTYARFQHHGCWDDRRFTQDYVYHTWLPKSSRRFVSSVEIEKYGDIPPHFGNEMGDWHFLFPLAPTSL
jgi:predicted transcriptional regulator YdeE